MTEPKPIRVLFCLSVLPAFFEAGSEERRAAMEAIPPAFDDLGGRFGADVLATFDDDMVLVGPSVSFPWTSYIVADLPDLDAATAICNILRETEVGDHRLWRYLRIEARIGRALFFGNA